MDFTRDVLRALYGDLLVELTSARFEHSLSVGQKVATIAADAPAGVRADLVVAGALHDIGYSQRLAHLGFHPIDGARALVEMGFSPIVCDLVATHTLAAYEARERGLDLDLFDPFLSDHPAIEHLRQMLSWADLTTGPTGAPVTVVQRVDEILDRYEPSDVVHQYVTRNRELMLRVGAEPPAVASSRDSLDPRSLRSRTTSR